MARPYLRISQNMSGARSQTESAAIDSDTVLEAMLGQCNPAGLEALVRRSLALLKTGNSQQALMRADRAARLEPSRPELQLLKGQCLQQLGQHSRALHCYLEARRLAPDFSPALRALLLLGKKTGTIPRTFLERLQDQLTSLSKGQGHIKLRTARIDDLPTQDQVAAGSTIVDVIIPVYKNFELTRACIASVLASGDRLAREIVVIDDASPEPQLCSWLLQLAEYGLITLLKNNQNLGFILSVNRALELHPERDVVLLNSDTEVTGDWLTRLNAAAYRGPRIGSVTPLSSNGEHFSFPTPFSIGPMPHDGELASLQQAAAHCNPGCSIEVPFGIGFCLYLRRECLNETGYLDDIELSRGYGEEVDLCLRASALGWTHVCALDTYVAHKGNASFGEEKALLVRNNNRLIRARHPLARQLYSDFIAQDPIQPYRQAIERHLIAYNQTTTILVVVNGTQSEEWLQVKLLREFALSDRDFLVLQTCAEGIRGHKLFGYGLRRPKNFAYDLPSDLELLIHDIKALCVNHIVFFDVAHQTPDVLELPKRLQLTYEIRADDYSLYCPQRYLSVNGEFCDDPLEPSVCEECLKCNGWRVGHLANLTNYRQNMTQFVARSDRLLVDSDQTAQRFARRFPHARIEIHQVENRLTSLQVSKSAGAESMPKIPQIAVIGPLTAQGGYGRLLALARVCAQDNLPIEFIVIGETLNDAALMATRKVWVTGALNSCEPPKDLAILFKPAAALYLATWPEANGTQLQTTMSLGLPLFLWSCTPEAPTLERYPCTVIPANTSVHQVACQLIENLVPPPHE